MNEDNEQVKSLWESQKQWKNLTNPLTQDPEIHAQINNLLIISYWNFRKKKGIPKGTYEPEINFQGFGKFDDFSEKTKTGNTKMGHCKLDIDIWRERTLINGKEVETSKTYEGTMSIFLNQKYLLNKLGMNEFISDYKETERNINWSTLPIGFEELIATIAHELAHAFQNTINFKEDEKSECESSGKRDANGNLLYPELVAEHTALTEEIKQMIESSSEYQEFKEFWKEGKIVTKKIKTKEADSNSSQLLSDKIKDTTNETSDASAKGVKKAGAGLEKAGKSLEGAADNNQWPRWVLPVGIGLGVLLLIGIIIWIFKPKKR